MSKRRSISKKINLQLDYPSPEQNYSATSDVYMQETYFGEKILDDDLHLDSESSTKSSATFDFIHDDDLYDIDSLGFSKSSGSSTSGDDLEHEASKRVSQEFEKFENAIYGEDHSTVPEENESKQWKDQFPHIRIVGSLISASAPYAEETSGYYEEILAEHSDTDIGCENNGQSTHADNMRNKIKETVINNVLKQIQTRLSTKPNTTSSSSTSTSTPQLTKTPKICLNSGSSRKLDASIAPCASKDNFLQISSQPLTSSPMRYPKFEYQSPVMRSHLSASKWQRDSCNEHSSLPHISNSYVPYQSHISGKMAPLSANRNEKKLSRYSANSRQKSGTSIPKTNTKFTNSETSPRFRNVTLPPIQNLNLSIEGDSPRANTPRKLLHKK